MNTPAQSAVNPLYELVRGTLSEMRETMLERDRLLREDIRDFKEDIKDAVGELRADVRAARVEVQELRELHLKCPAPGAVARLEETAKLRLIRKGNEDSSDGIPMIKVNPALAGKWVQILAVVIASGLAGWGAFMEVFK